MELAVFAVALGRLGVAAISVVPLGEPLG